VVISQWAHRPWNLESLEAAPVWLVAMAAQPAKWKKLEEGTPVLCGSLFSEVGPRESGQVSRSTWVS
jgi:hypothetical protein